MNWKTTVVLAAIALGVFVYLRFFELKQPGTEEARRQAQNVVNFDRDKIDGIVILNGDEKIELRRRDNRWRLETPIKDQADSSLIDNLLSDLGNWQKEGTISAKEIDADKSKLNEYGLNNPKLRLKLIGQDKPPAILFGKDAALEGKMYVRFENSKETYLAGQSIKKDIDKKPEEFRDRKLTDLITAQVSRVILKTPTGEIELQKKGDHWEILKPLRAPGDDQKIGDLIAQVTASRIQQFVADDHGDLRRLWIGRAARRNHAVYSGGRAGAAAPDRRRAGEAEGPNLCPVRAARIRLHPAEEDRRDPQHKTRRSARPPSGSNRHKHS